MMTRPAPLTVASPNDTDVVIVRKFHAPAALVWKAHTTPELVQKWLLGPPGWTMPLCLFEPHVGGKFRYRWENTGGDQPGFSIHGEIREFEPPTRMVHTELFEMDSGPPTLEPAIVVTEFAETDGITTMTMTIRYPDRATRDQAIGTGMTEGMEMSYQGLDALLAA